MSKTTALEHTPIDQLDPKEFIIIKGARVNNLKNLSVAIPRNKLVVVTGLSGSGKSSLAFDTLFAEGQRMYVESLSSYARQFLGRMEKPEVDYIKGVSPAIAIEQKVSTRNPRSTVGTTTEIYDYLKLLFARIGKTYSPISGKEVQRDSVTSIVEFILSKEEGTKLMILCPLITKEDRSLEDELNVLLQKGYTRVIYAGQPHFIEELLEKPNELKEEDIEILIDRGVVQHDEDTQFRFSDSVQTALFEGQGDCIIDIPGEGRTSFSDRFEADGMLFEEPSVNLFTFNNPYGACKRCEGFGKILGIDPDLVIPDKSLSVYDGVIAPWRSETMRKWLAPLLKHGIEFDFPIHRAYADLTHEEQEVLWTGNKYFKGLNKFFEYLESKTHKIQYRVMLSRYRGRTDCPECKGTRLRKDASYVKIEKKSITDLVLMPIGRLTDFFEQLELTTHEEKVAGRLLKEIKNRIDYLQRVGLSYLTLNRLTNTLSGGEYQRIKLATSLGSALVGSMYILDEPSIGLHPRDTDRLISVLKSLRDLGNTVVVVEHEEKVMQAADEIIDIGPDAGSNGGELVFQGTLPDLIGQGNTHTARFLNGTDRMEVPKQRRKWNDKLIIKGARENNLKNIDAEIPLGVLSVVTGVSGSGKSTLIKRILYPALGKMLGTVGEQTGKMEALEGSLKKVSQIEFVDQNPIGKSSRSNPVTYVKAYDAIRALFTDQPLAKQRNYKPAFFSFNVDGGRCETCQGEGVVKIEMQFMADIHLTCESCKGQRFKQEILEVKYNDKNIADVLDMTIDDAMEFFEGEKSIINKLAPLQEVGLGYIRLGQSSNSLSGGEAQRVKLAYFLGKGKSSNKDHILFIFDEPTTGLHFHDISKLMYSINALIEQGNSVLIIEHNTEVIKCADWIIDLGPEGGDAGGKVCYAGTPEDMVVLKDENHTAKYLAEVL
ncbi:MULTISPECIES: excinuclease ABC subunit UvrA [Roseivirga]|uniref:UvrABC system protein A n=1 Tax=Roseivirga spongicola TaxID=333140 RepID=A0A150XG65_9BACT|nr:MULTISPECIES: excinuclease ABC subunit UvrA [Roseivirga]KYG77699.1 ABC-ATPase UvrA [Roseivirga spongicola]MBO6661495.1 excinuclease ABC subunit UvrA [Roseivirga sp.]MBO6908521.1 excinuclease ABC subunit UvrA [Roseivirga sp.]WPZ11421.1 excinuclease ABC subunit UvrA [Roseivirga spongicola]